LTIVIDYENGKSGTTEDVDKLAKSTIEVVTLPIEVLPQMNLTKRLIINRGIGLVADHEVKKVLATPVNMLIDKNK
jgi:hypothetical protein